MDLLDQRCGRLLLTCVLTLATCHRVQPTEGSTFRSDRGNAVVASGLATTCGGGACCGALFQTAAIPKEIVDQLTVTANTLNFTSSAERMMDDPFVSMKVPTSATDSNEQTSPFLADLMYVANFNSSSSSVRMSFVDEGENLGPAIWSYVDVTVLPLITGGSEIYIFVLSGREETQEDSNGYNYGECGRHVLTWLNFIVTCLVVVSPVFYYMSLIWLCVYCVRSRTEVVELRGYSAFVLNQATVACDRMHGT